ncbi:phage tail tube protein [Paracoccus methylarcula]|uniref:Phage tail protein n=1 Tax=Paracoccus methylarcula TaxID=72022 RepID=A0A3R7LQJ0_9RHOB|nr:phage tail tube protein [Paracoccus methylarcula]RNF35390.1 phage tail protein [Paracoccus methylarcula]
MPDGMIGYGSTVRIGQGATPTWTEIELVGDITLPDEQVDEVDITHMKSPGRRRQFIAGLIDGGEVTVPMNYIPGSVTDVLLLDIKSTGEEIILEITPGEGSAPEQYWAFLKGYARSAPVDDKMTAEATFRLSAQIVAGP